VIYLYDEEDKKLILDDCDIRYTSFHQSKQEMLIRVFFTNEDVWSACYRMKNEQELACYRKTIGSLTHWLEHPKKWGKE